MDSQLNTQRDVRLIQSPVLIHEDVFLFVSVYLGLFDRARELPNYTGAYVVL